METTTVSLDEIRKRFEAANEGETFGWFTEQFGHIEQRANQKPVTEIRLATGPVKLDALELKSPWILVIDGDLEVTGDVDLRTEPYDMSVFVVLGNVRAKNFRYSGSACCFVSKAVELTGGCFGDHGDESAELHTEKLKARVVVLDHVTGLNAGELDAVVFASEGWGLPLTFSAEDNAADFLVAEALNEDGEYGYREMWDVMTSGRDPFLPGAYEKLRARRVETEDRVKPQ